MAGIRREVISIYKILQFCVDTAAPVHVAAVPSEYAATTRLDGNFSLVLSKPATAPSHACVY